MEEGRRRYDSSSSPFSLLAKLQILGWGCQPHYLEGKESWFPTPGSWWGPCAATLACCVWMRSLSLTGTLGPGWPLGGVCAYCLTRMWWGQLLSQCPSPGEAERATAGPAAGQLPFLRGCLPARWCLMQSKAGLSAGILASLSLGDLKMGLGPLCNPCSGKGRAQGESRPQGNSFPGEAPAGTKSQSLWNRARHWWRKKLISPSCGACSTGNVALWDSCKFRHVN